MNKMTKMIVTLTVIGVISGLILSFVYSWALPKIEANQITETKAAIYKVLPETKDYKKVVKGELEYFKCLDSSKNIIGTAIICKGNGYQGEIKLMIGVNADFTKFTGMIVLEQLETPGLGAKIVEKKFTDQFSKLAVRPPIEYVKGIAPEKPNEIQAIAGATISSKAVVEIINKTVEEWMNANE
jgi:H+/Na+-translocating ferredoxin:NAD+ oxidoreductase subunit G